MTGQRAYCFVLSWPFTEVGGVNQVVNNLMRELESRGDERLTALALETAWDAPQGEQASLCGTKRLGLRLRSPEPGKRLKDTVGFLLHLPGTLLKLRKMANQYAIAVFNIHFPCLEAINFVLLKLLHLFPGEVILSLHGSEIRTANQQRGVSRFLWKLLLRNAGAVVACSDGLREEALLVEPRCRAITIHNGINIENFAAAETRSFWPPELESRRVVMNVGSFEYRKGHDVLINAFQRVAAIHQDSALLLVGKPGPVSAAVRQLIRGTGLQNRIFILENVPHAAIYDLLTRAALFVLSSRWRKGEMGEGFAVAILEAAAAGIPVVATASCGVEELIRDGETGRVTPLEDAGALAQAICETLEQPVAAATMARRLHALVREQFTWGNALDRYLEICEACRSAR